jgi:hypothetical protein
MMKEHKENGKEKMRKTYFSKYKTKTTLATIFRILGSSVERLWPAVGNWAGLLSAESHQRYFCHFDHFTFRRHQGIRVRQKPESEYFLEILSFISFLTSVSRFCVSRLAEKNRTHSKMRLQEPENSSGSSTLSMLWKLSVPVPLAEFWAALSAEFWAALSAALLPAILTAVLAAFWASLLAAFLVLLLGERL